MNALRLALPFSQMVRDWSERRAQPVDTLELGQRNIYILPTPAGLMFALTLVVLLLAAINYQLSMGYALTFLLAGGGLVSMHVTHATLRGLTLHLQPPAPAFAGEAAPITIELGGGSSGKARYGIGLRLADAPADSLAWIDLAAGGHARVTLAHTPARRGLVRVPVIGIETRFPLGLFRAWAVWRPANRVLVYPRPEKPAAPWPQAPAPAADGQPGSRTVDGGETDGVRAYRRGDPPNRIAWKKAARAWASGGELVSRDARTLASQQLWLDWHDVAGMDVEQRLSRLCAWVLEAERADLPFGLSIPGHRLPPAQGEAHRRAALEALATFPGASA